MAPLTLEKNDDKISDKKSLMKCKKIKVKLMFRRINMAIFYRSRSSDHNAVS